MNRGIDVLQASWADVVRLTVAVADPDAALPVIGEVTQTEIAPVPLGNRIVEVPVAR